MYVTKGVDYNQKPNFSLRYPHLTVTFFGVSLWLKSLKMKLKSLGLMKLQACNLVKDILLLLQRYFLKILNNTFQTIILRNSDVWDQSVCACQITADFYTICSISWKSIREKHSNGGVLKMVA